ncbi:MAG: redoxin domain-containing protein [Muribaculaceae bacterium]|nr:redoxin domain-containing protein [Muribaculaceae bacterium]
MKKTVLIAALFVGLIVVAVGYSDSQYRTAIGRMAPALSLVQADSLLTLQDMRGDYVLLNFWDSGDARSREAANIYTAWVRNHHMKNLRFVSVNFDESEGLFREIVRSDSLETSQQFHVNGDMAKAIVDNYGLKDGYGTVLIGPDGHIVAHNPTGTKLEKFLSGTKPDLHRSVRKVPS